MMEIISATLMLVGAFFMVVAGVGLVRMPDLFLRMSASTKAATLGVGCTLLGVAVYFGDVTAFMRAGAIILFLLATAPVAAHLIGRAAYKDGVSLWDKTLFDELGQYYEQETPRRDWSTGLDVRPSPKSRNLPKKGVENTI